MAVSLKAEENITVMHEEVEENGGDVDDIDDVLSLEKILSTELKNVSASFVTWQTSPDKKYKLCIFYVRFPSFSSNIQSITFLFSSSGEAENVLNVLRNAGVGHDFNSSIRLVSIY